MVIYFYDRLFHDNRHLRALFPARMDEQRDRLLGALLAVVQDASRPDDLIPRLEQLGRDHHKFGVRPAHYASVGKALIAAVSRFAGPAWTPEVEQVWLARYTIAVIIMLAAADHDDRPPFWYATVVGHRRYGADMAILHLRPHHPYPYAAGQYATLVSRRLPRVWRPYAMAHAPGSQDLLEFTSELVLRQEGIPAEAVKLGHRGEDRFLRDVGQRHDGWSYCSRTTGTCSDSSVNVYREPAVDGVGSEQAPDVVRREPDQLVVDVTKIGVRGRDETAADGKPSWVRSTAAKYCSHGHPWGPTRRRPAP